MDRRGTPRYHDFESLRHSHPAWRLLRADHASLIIGFLYTVFIAPNCRALAQEVLVSQLDDYLFQLRDSALGDDAFPQSALAYLDAWASDENGWLRKYYPSDSDEPHFDVTPSAERAIEWLISLERRDFIATESRLMMVFELLRQIVHGTQSDPDLRIAELQKRKAALDAEITRIRGGNVPLMDRTQIKDRFVQMENTARELLSDFRQVEQNFRGLDRTARERIATWESGKGALLQDIFGDRDAIADSDQGKSFRAFWDFLMSSARQEELSELLRDVFVLEAVQDLNPDRRLLHIHYDWLEAGEVAQRMVARLSEQLRRLLDDRVILENRRIVVLIREIEQHAIAVREKPPRDAAFIDLEDSAPKIALVMDRPLFRPPEKVDLAGRVIVDGAVEFSVDALFDQRYVDKTQLVSQIQQSLSVREHVSLADVVRDHPLENGLAEVITYLSIAVESPACVIDEKHTQQLEWYDSNGIGRRATMPLVVFRR
jgi:flagellar motility protein MotE (MotC chaperone)